MYYSQLITLYFSTIEKPTITQCPDNNIAFLFFFSPPRYAELFADERRMENTRGRPRLQI